MHLGPHVVECEGVGEGLAGRLDGEGVGVIAHGEPGHRSINSTAITQMILRTTSLIVTLPPQPLHTGFPRSLEGSWVSW